MVSLSYEKGEGLRSGLGKRHRKNLLYSFRLYYREGQDRGIFFTLRLYLNPIDVKIPKIV